MKTVYWYEIASAHALAMAEVEALKNNSVGLSYADHTQDNDAIDYIEAMLGDKIYCAMFETYTGDYTNIFIKLFKYDSWHKVYTFEVDDKPTKVNFRRGKEGSDIFALMPYEPGDVYGRCACYTFWGHCAADYTFSVSQSKPASFSEYRGLYKAMLQAGYNIQVIKRYSGK